MICNGSASESETQERRFDASLANDEERGLQRHRYLEFGEERLVEFDHADLAWSGTFESHSSLGHGEYQDRLRAIHMRKTGWTKTDIAKDLSRSEKFVARWWQMEPLAVPRPPGVHQYLAHGMMAGRQFERTNMWRGVEVVRGFLKDTAGLYDEITTRFANWKQAASETKDFRTASYFLRYDREGKMRLMSMRSATYERGVASRLDALVQQIHCKVGVTDPEHGAGMYWFSDGDASVGSHRHVFWSARVALGANRIMMIDKIPILMQEGDLVIIGPQRHGVPPMPDVSGGSLRISVPFRPNAKIEKMAGTDHDETAEGFATTVDAEQVNTNGKSVIADHASYSRWDDRSGWDEVAAWGEEVGAGDEALEQLLTLGFDAVASAGALRVFGGDVERAVDALLNAEHAELFVRIGSIESLDGSADMWTMADDDEALAHRLQMEELAGERHDKELEAQFAEYDRVVDIAEAEKSWDGYGDLMHNPMRRATLNLEMLGPQTLYSLGASMRTEKLFFELLSLHSIRVLYDLRPTNYYDEVRCQQPHFEVRVLKSLCRQRGIHYRHVAVGRETAYGTLKHLQSDEVQHILVELCWQAKWRGRTAFLGNDEDWRADGRLAVAEELAKHGHHIEHIMANGACEIHTVGMDMPDFLLQEESRLRKVHAQRQAGEFHQREKSAVDRSTEAVARTLTTEKPEFDVSAELRDAENQTDLVRAQKRMVRMQYSESKKEPGLGKKKLLAMPAHIARQAEEARLRNEAKKVKKPEMGQGTNSAVAMEGAGASASSSSSWQPSGHAENTMALAGSGATAAAISSVDFDIVEVRPARRTGRWGYGGLRPGEDSRDADDVSCHDAEPALLVAPLVTQEASSAQFGVSAEVPQGSEMPVVAHVPNPGAVANPLRARQGRWSSRRQNDL